MRRIARWLTTSHRLLHISWLTLTGPSGQVVRLVWVQWGRAVAEDDQSAAAAALWHAGFR